MGKCPFIAVQRLIREITRDASGTVIGEKETPVQELRECLRQECELYDSVVGRCSVPAIEAKLSAAEGVRPPGGDPAAEIKETRENMAALLLHVLKKADTHNDLLQHLNESVKGMSRAPSDGDGQALVQIGSKLDELGAKLSALVEQMKPQAEEGSSLARPLSEMKEALSQSQTKFGDILELMLEDHQRRATEGSKTVALLEALGSKQEAMAGAIVQGLKELAEASAVQKPQESALVESVNRLESALQRYAEAEAKRQAEMEAVGAKMVDVQQSIQNLLEAQRNEQRAASNERRRREAEEHNERGVMYFHRRELAAAEREFNQALEIRPDFAEAYNNLGLVLSDLGKRDEAVASFRKAIDLAPEAPEAYNNLGCLYKVRKDFQQAVELFNQAIAKREDYALAYFNLGLAYEETEKFEAAIKAWEKVLTLQPTHEEARRKLATYRARRI